MDETLIHFPEDYLENFASIYKEKIAVRPYAMEFLQAVSKYFEIIIFTAAT